MSEEGVGIDQRFPELRQEELHQVVPDLHQRVRRTLQFSRPTDLIFDSTKGLMQTERTRSAASYQITNSPSINEDEIVIEKHQEIGRPNLVGETLRFRFGNPMHKDSVYIQYSRALKKGGVKTFANNLIAIRLAEKFVTRMEKDLRTNKI